MALYPGIALLAVNIVMGMLICYYFSRQKINELDEHIEELEDSLKKGNANIKKLKKTGEDQETKLEDQNDRVNNLLETIDNLNIQVQDKKNNIDKLNTELEVSYRLNESTTARAENAEDRNRELEIILQDKEYNITALEAKSRVMQDNFAFLAGIGPKVSAMLRLAGINSFDQLSKTNVNKIKEILGAENPGLVRIIDPTSWPEQAKMAAEGRWEALSELQDSIKTRARTN